MQTQEARRFTLHWRSLLPRRYFVILSYHFKKPLENNWIIYIICFANKKAVNELMSVKKSCILKYIKRKTGQFAIFFFLDLVFKTRKWYVENGTKWKMNIYIYIYNIYTYIYIIIITISIITIFIIIVNNTYIIYNIKSKLIKTRCQNIFENV